MSGKKKGPDEIFCTSCGEAIKEDAEICPNCGVRNKKSTGGGGTGGGSSGSHDPSQYQTTVSDTWWYGVAGGVGLWVFAFILSSVSSSGGALNGVAGLLILLAWVGLPLSAYFDMQYVRANSEWNPEDILWVILLAIWLVNIPAGAVYLYRRHEVLGEP